MASAKTPNDSLQQVVSFEIKIGGKALPKEMVVMKIHVKSEANKISRAYISIIGGNSYENTFTESENEDFEPGKDVEISLGYDQKNTSVFSGIIVKHSLEISAGYLSYSSRNLLVLEAADKAIKMTIEKKSELYEDKKDSDIITTLISGAGLTKTVEATTLQHPFISRHNCTDWEFLLNRAKVNGMLVFNSSNKITVESPKASSTDKATLTYGKDIISFKGDLDSSNQFQQLESKNYDIYTEKEVTQSGEDPKFDAPGNITGATLGKVVAPTKVSLNVPVPIVSKELKSVADSALILSRLKRMSGEMTFRGMADVTLGCHLNLDGLGKLFNGLVYITGVEHRVENGQFITKAIFGLRNELYRYPDGGDLNLLPSMSGLHVGIVKKIDEDPDKQNRIQVMLPGIKNSGNGIWAMLGHFYANNDAGSFFVPELNSEVVVGFINNDPRFPVVLGSLYSKNNKPKETFTKDNFVKAIQTKAGVRLEFEDKDKYFKVITPGNNTLLICDKSKGVKIEDENKNVITTSDTGITIESKKDITITASGNLELKGTKGIVINSSSGDVKVDGKNVNLKGKAKVEVNGSSGTDIKSSGSVNIKGSMVNVN